MIANVQFWQHTRPIVEYLMKQRDQVASTVQIADALGGPEFATRDALLRLKKVGRVEEIHPNLWHLE